MSSAGPQKSAETDAMAEWVIVSQQDVVAAEEQSDWVGLAEGERYG